MELNFLENIYENKNKLSVSNFLRERTISSMDCNEYKEKICPQTPRIKQIIIKNNIIYKRPQKAPEIPFLELTLPPIIEEVNEEDSNLQRICYFPHDQQSILLSNYFSRQLPQYAQFAQLLDETSTENDTLSTVSYSQSMINLTGKTEFLGSPLSGAPSQFIAKSEIQLKKCKSVKLEKKKNRNRAASVALPRFSIYSFLKKIIRKQKRHNNHNNNEF